MPLLAVVGKAATPNLKGVGNLAPSAGTFDGFGDWEYVTYTTTSYANTFPTFYLTQTGTVAGGDIYLEIEGV